MKSVFEIKQKAENQLVIYIYDDVEGDSYDWWTGKKIESETSAKYIKNELAKYPNATQIDVHINSYGGSVFEGTAIYNLLRQHPAHKTVYIDGFACSIASVIAMAGDEVVMPKNTLMMIHNMWMGVYGNAHELRKAADDLDVINSAGRQAYLSKAGDKITEENLVEMMDAETWLTAEQCVEFGLADRYAEHDADMDKANQILQKASLNIEQRIKFQKSLSAQLRELTEPKKEPERKEPEPQQKKDEPLTILDVLSGRKK